MQADTVFDGFSFRDNGIILTNIGYMNVAKRSNQLEQRANRDGAVLVQSQLGTKPITLEGYYTGATAVAAQNMYDTLTQALNRQQRPLIVPHAGGTRKFICTPENIIITEPNGLNRITFSFDFVVPEGSSIAESPITLLTQTGIATSTTTIPHSVLGSVKARPLITITIGAVTGGTAATVSVRNARDFTGLTILRNFTAGDTLIIDSDNFQIFHNGVLVEPVGRIPTWEPGVGSLYYSDTFTTRTVNITATYYPKNL